MNSLELMQDTTSMTKRSANLFAFTLVVWILTTRSSMAVNEDSTSTTFSKSSFFHVQSFDGGPSSQRVLELCDSLRIELARVWNGKSSPTTWEPRCEVVLHPSRESYSKAVGTGGSSSNGSSFVQLKAGGVTSRRMDLLLDQHGALTSLPHELTHVILADFFNGRQPPLWLDKGVAMLADTREKQLLHERDCMDAISSTNALAMDALLRLDQFTSPSQVAPFYGQSLTLARMLAHQKSPETLIEFAKDSMDHGIAAALKQHYQIDDVRELERLWKLEIQTLKSSTNRKTFAFVRFQP